MVSGGRSVPKVACLCDHARMSKKLPGRSLERVGHTAHDSAESMLGLSLAINVVFAGRDRTPVFANSGTLPDGGVRVDFGLFHETKDAPPQSAQT